MMLFLINDVINYIISLTPGIRKSAITRLPTKFTCNKSLFVNPFATTGFYNRHKIRNAGGNWHPEKNMNMI